MAITSYPFDEQSITESQFSALFRELQDTGVAASADSTSLKVSGDSSGMSVKVQPGFAIVRGHAVNSSTIETVTIATADATQPRTDRVVLRLDPATNGITLAVVQGTPGGSTPALTQTDTGTYELLLADVTVAAGAANISAGAVADRRSFSGMRVNTWPTSRRPATPRMAQLGWNTTDSKWEFWNGSAWTDLAPTVNWSTIEGRPSTFAPSTHSHAWSEITDKPATFAPSAHTHAYSSLTGIPTSFNPAPHSHGEYSLWNHNHSGVYAAYSHGHSGYASSGHGHGDTYAYQTNGDVYGKNRDRHVQWTNGTGRVHSESVSGGGTYYSVWVDGSGNFARNTSSRRFKENIRTHEVDPLAVLSLRPVMYDRINGNPDEYGLIAEEVAEHLPELAVRNAEGEIDALRYDLLAVAMLGIIKEQQLRLDALEAIVDDVCKCDGDD